MVKDFHLTIFFRSQEFTLSTPISLSLNVLPNGDRVGIWLANNYAWFRYFYGAISNYTSRISVIDSEEYVTIVDMSVKT